jgi:hypothetical protein
MDAAPAPDPKSDFRTIAHSGGTVTIDVSRDPATGLKRYQLTWNHCRPNAGGFFCGVRTSARNCRVADEPRRNRFTDRPSAYTGLLSSFRRLR